MMKFNKKQKYINYKQRKINRRYRNSLITNGLIVIMILAIVSVMKVSGNNKIEDENSHTVYESRTELDHNTVNPSANVSSENNTTLEIESDVVTYSRNLSEDDKYLLSKIAMAEAEGESLQTKIFVIFTVLNRVESKQFPDTIKEVIFQKYKGVYQFTPVMDGGRWWTTEPNDECWEAVEIVNKTKEDLSKGSLYFESCSGDSWHSRNLELILECDNTRFYK